MLLGDLNCSPNLRRGYSDRNTSRRDAADKELLAFIEATSANWTPAAGPTWRNLAGSQRATLDHMLTWGLNYEHEPVARWPGANPSSNLGMHNASHDHTPVYASIRMEGGVWQRPVHSVRGYRFDAARFVTVRDAWAEKCQESLQQLPQEILTGPALADRFRQQCEVLKQCAQDCLQSLFPRSNRARERKPGRSKEQALLTKEINVLSAALREGMRGDSDTLTASARKACALGGLGAVNDDLLKLLMRHPVWVAEMRRLRSVRQHRMATIARQQMTANLSRAKARVRALFAHGVKGIQKARGKRGGLPQATEVKQTLVTGVKWRIQQSKTEVQSTNFLATKPASLSVTCTFPEDTYWCVAADRVGEAGALLRWIGDRHPAGCVPGSILV